MSARKTIKSMVEELLAEGLTIDRIWHYLQVDNHHRRIGWNYVKKIERDWRRKAAA